MIQEKLVEKAADGLIALVVIVVAVLGTLAVLGGTVLDLLALL